ncbi:MAG: hypothetical protein ACKVIX_06685 [Sphingomonadales bacterium]
MILSKNLLTPALKEGLRLSQIGLTLFWVLAIFPVAFSILYALSYSLGLIGYLNDGLTFEYFKRIWQNNEILPSFILSFYISFMSTSLTVFLGLLITTGLWNSMQKGILSVLIYLPLILPSAVAGLFVYLFLSSSGILSRVFIKLGFIQSMQDFPALINDPWAIGIIVAQVGIGTPFFALLFSQIFNIEKLKDIQNLAYSLGATKFDVFRRTTLPILLLKSRHQIILSFIFVFGSFEIPSILGQHAPEMISVLAIRKMGLFEIGQKPEAFVVAFLYCLVVIGILAFSFKVDKK